MSTNRVKRLLRKIENIRGNRTKKRRLSGSDEDSLKGPSSMWTPKSMGDFPTTNIYNSTSRSPPAELFRKDLISAMKLPDSEPLASDEYWFISDQWKQEWERGVQVPVNPEVLPEPVLRILRKRDKSADFKLPKKLIRISPQDDDFDEDVHQMSAVPAQSEKMCRYDLDDCDLHWLTTLNDQRKDLGLSSIDEAIMERVMEELETQCYENMQEAIQSETGLGIEYDEDVICDVCRSPDSEEGNEMVFCDSCDICVHQACYGITSIPEGSWMCRTCSLAIKPDCILCPNKGGAMKSTRSGQKWAHVSCALWIPEVSIGCVEKMEPITKIALIPPSRWALICCLCRDRIGACIQCSVKSCKTAYHVSCGFQNGLDMKAVVEEDNIEDGLKLRSYCPKHSKNKDSGASSDSEGDDSNVDLLAKRRSEDKASIRAKRLYQIESTFFRYVNLSEVVTKTMVSSETVDFVYQYWKLKRRTLFNKPLLIPRSGENDALGRQQEDGLYARMKMFVHLRQDLERVRNLCYMVSRREKLSRSWCLLREQIFHKQVAVLTDDSLRLEESEKHEVVHSCHGANIYDHLYANDPTCCLKEKPPPPPPPTPKPGQHPDKRSRSTVEKEAVDPNGLVRSPPRKQRLLGAERLPNPYAKTYFFNGTNHRSQRRISGGSGAVKLEDDVVAPTGDASKRSTRSTDHHDSEKSTEDYRDSEDDSPLRGTLKIDFPSSSDDDSDVESARAVKDSLLCPSSSDGVVPSDKIDSGLCRDVFVDETVSEPQRLTEEVKLEPQLVEANDPDMDSSKMERQLRPHPRNGHRSTSSRRRTRRLSSSAEEEDDMEADVASPSTKENSAGGELLPASRSRSGSITTVRRLSSCTSVDGADDAAGGRHQQHRLCKTKVRFSRAMMKSPAEKVQERVKERTSGAGGCVDAPTGVPFMNKLRQESAKVHETLFANKLKSSLAGYRIPKKSRSESEDCDVFKLDLDATLTSGGCHSTLSSPPTPLPSPPAVVAPPPSFPSVPAAPNPAPSMVAIAMAKGARHVGTTKVQPTPAVDTTKVPPSRDSSATAPSSKSRVKVSLAKPSASSASGCLPADATDAKEIPPKLKLEVARVVLEDVKVTQPVDSSKASSRASVGTPARVARLSKTDSSKIEAKVSKLSARVHVSRISVDIERAPLRVSTDKSPSRAHLDKSSARIPVKTPVRVDKSPARTPIDKSPARSVEKSPARSDDKSPARSADKSPARSADKARLRAHVDKSLARVSVDKSPVRAPVDKSPRGASVDRSPGRSSGDKLAARVSSKQASSASRCGSHEKEQAVVDPPTTRSSRKDFESRPKSSGGVKACKVVVDGKNSSAANSDRTSRHHSNDPKVHPRTEPEISSESVVVDLAKSNSCSKDIKLPPKKIKSKIVEVGGASDVKVSSKVKNVKNSSITVDKSTPLSDFSKKCKSGKSVKSEQEVDAVELVESCPPPRDVKVHTEVNDKHPEASKEKIFSIADSVTQNARGHSKVNRSKVVPLSADVKVLTPVDVVDDIPTTNNVEINRKMNCPKVSSLTDFVDSRPLDTTKEMSIPPPVTDIIEPVSEIDETPPHNSCASTLKTEASAQENPLAIVNIVNSLRIALSCATPAANEISFVQTEVPPVKVDGVDKVDKVVAPVLDDDEFLLPVQVKENESGVMTPVVESLFRTENASKESVPSDVAVAAPCHDAIDVCESESVAAAIPLVDGAESTKPIATVDVVTPPADLVVPSLGTLSCNSEVKSTCEGPEISDVPPTITVEETVPISSDVCLPLTYDSENAEHAAQSTEAPAPPPVIITLPFSALLSSPVVEKTRHQRSSPKKESRSSSSRSRHRRRHAVEEQVTAVHTTPPPSPTTASPERRTPRREKHRDPLSTRSHRKQKHHPASEEQAEVGATLPPPPPPPASPLVNGGSPRLVIRLRKDPNFPKSQQWRRDCDVTEPPPPLVSVVRSEASSPSATTTSESPPNRIRLKLNAKLDMGGRRRYRKAELSPPPPSEEVVPTASPAYQRSSKYSMRTRTNLENSSAVNTGTNYS